MEQISSASVASTNNLVIKTKMQINRLHAENILPTRCKVFYVSYLPNWESSKSIRLRSPLPRGQASPVPGEEEDPRLAFFITEEYELLVNNSLVLQLTREILLAGNWIVFELGTGCS